MYIIGLKDLHWQLWIIFDFPLSFGLPAPAMVPKSSVAGAVR
jgi:hypothetical protein